MARDDITAYLELKVGHFRLALGAEHVVTILGDVGGADAVVAQSDHVPLVDLQTVFGGPPRSTIPFAVVFEVGKSRAALGADRVDHLRYKTAPTLLPMPGFGLKAAALFAGVLRDERGLVLILNPTAGIALTTGKKFGI